MDRASVYRRALACIGEAEYVEGSPTAEACERAYKATLMEACARYDWSFLRRIRYVKGETGVVEGYVLYRLPGDCVKVVRMECGGRRAEWPEMVAEGVMLPEGEGGGVMKVVYQADLLGDLGVLEEARTGLFAEGVVCLLASKICMQVTSNMQLALEMKRQAEGHFYQAILNDKQQDWSAAKAPRALMARIKG